ncbi:putative transcriptional regulator, PucR family [Desulfitobacterium hafniense DCB-2]|uniref:Putative transcriptional regulator, PucR family n=1 Tax=Desulfitobacterium hafniense (strain DSM 10664 / DCB-2) TaxID=272564 RepID=B8FZU5_DESHD|nr:helix-turn-helix domain-containing protein [Desulfitobacterium hafniense]ACL19169.1 putative transcriptional regulator, PucR family [Desulfitobacterium hafniense DCB-2]
MKLCMGIIEDGISGDIIYKNYLNTDIPFNLERAEMYCESTKVLNAGVLNIAHAENLPEEMIVQEGAALICIGMPAELYTKSPLILLVLDQSKKVAELSNEVNRIFFEYNSLELRLHEAVNKGKSIQYLVEQMAQFLNNELVVMNAEFKLIGQSNSTIHMCEISGIKQPDSHGRLSTEHVEFFKNDLIYSNVKNMREPFIYEPSIFICRVICMNVFFQDDFVCRVVIAEDRSTFRGYEAGLLHFFTSFIQLVYDLAGYSGDIMPREHMVEIFSALISGESIESWRLKNSVSQHGWNYDGPFLCASIMPSDRDYYNRTIPYYCQMINRDFKGCCAFEYERKIVCIVNLEYYNGSGECFNSVYLETLRDGYFRVGYSNVFTSIVDIQAHYVQAKISLRIGLDQFPSRWYYKFSDIVLFYMESKLTEELDGQFLCSPKIIGLDSYDRANSSDYLHTLKVYLDNQMNAVKTAKDLFIHRATMVNRLERIKELAGINFKDPDDILYIKISIRLFYKADRRG